MNDDAAGAASPVEIETLDAAALAADDGLWRLYDAAFPADEREPRAVVVAGAVVGVGAAPRRRRLPPGSFAQGKALRRRAGLRDGPG